MIRISLAHPQYHSIGVTFSFAIAKFGPVQGSPGKAGRCLLGSQQDDPSGSWRVVTAHQCQAFVAAWGCNPKVLAISEISFWTLVVG